jgi:hypothetical protein
MEGAKNFDMVKEHAALNGDYENAVEKVIYYATKDHQNAGDVNISEHAKRIIEEGKYSQEAMIGLSRAMEDWKIDPVTPKEITFDSIRKSIDQALDQYNKNPSISARYNIENLIEYAEERNVKLPKSQIEKMRTGLEEGKETVNGLVGVIDRAAEKLGNKDLSWYKAEDPKPNRPLFKLQDSNDVTYAFIVERQRNDNHEKFYAAYWIEENGKGRASKPIKTSGNVDILKNSISAYCTGVAINTVTVEKLKEYAETKNLKVRPETQERWGELISRGEKKETIVSFIDKKSVEFQNKEKPKAKDLGIDL